MSKFFHTGDLGCVGVVKPYLQRELALCRQKQTAINPVGQFVVEYGHPFRGIPLPKKIKRGHPKKAFENAAANAYDINEPANQYCYAEDFAVDPSHSLDVFFHAWLVDGDGKAVDPTFDARRCYYLGVVIPRKLLVFIQQKTKRAGVFSGEMGPRLIDFWWTTQSGSSFSDQSMATRFKQLIRHRPDHPSVPEYELLTR